MGVAGSPDGPPYELDRLGWLQFERLCSSILQIAFGCASLTWLGRAGHGRVTTVERELQIRVGRRPLVPPVSVIAAWVPDSESRWERFTRLVEYVARLAETNQLGTSVLVLTNLPGVEAGRALQLACVANGRKLSVLGSGELSELLDAHAALRMAMPSVLGVHAERFDPRARSGFDLDAAAALASVFWPTSAYARACDVLGAHQFVVLTGPPEMGKTAIARMVALALMTDGWDAHECTRPSQVLNTYREGDRQVFIADDAFGSTEYLPDAGERWAQALGRLLPLLDSRHRLIWTSRPAPLKAGLRRVQRERGAERFPSPGEVTVDAGDLSLAEKTLILFRHAKASQPVGDTVRQHGVAIVEHPHFTPERIRRLIMLLTGWPPGAALAEHDSLAVAIDDALASPTEAMSASYAALADEHRQLLIAVLDVPTGVFDQRALAAALRRHCPVGLTRPPNELIDRLTDHFLRISSLGVGWVHPSWRDLVIEELRCDPVQRRHFLNSCGIDGVLLAVSVEGGRCGERQLPLLIDDSDWDTLTDRLAQLLRELEDRDVSRLLHGLRGLLDANLALSPSIEARNLTIYVLGATRATWEAQRRQLPASLVHPWYQLRTTLGAPDHMLPLARTWLELHPGTIGPREFSLAELRRIDEWLELAEILDEHDVYQLNSFGFAEDRQLLKSLAVQLAARRAPETLQLIGVILIRIVNLLPELGGIASKISRRARTQDLKARDWWVPADIDLPPTNELVIGPSDFKRADINQVLDDL